ncbi:MAG: lytic transglycosylase domain-containing protein [Sphingomicrobium sp.]|nr:lytic transglycosylase domain-containing protein [Sphingomonadales bacterium]
MLPLFVLLAAQVDPLAPLPTAKVPTVSVPATPPPGPALVPIAPVVVPKDWRAEFAAIRAGDWAGATAGIAALPDGLLKPVAKAELYLTKGSPVVSIDDLQGLLNEAPELAQAEQIERLAASRGSIQVMAIPEQPVIGLGAGPRRGRSKPVGGDPLADQLRSALDPLLKIDSADAAEALMLQSAPLLTPEGRAEAAQRVAWSYYSLGRDADAVRVAEAGRVGAAGDWAVNASWVSGLASWRLNDCTSAGARFREVSAGTRESELAAAANYWAARAAQACRQPEAVAPLLKAAARSPESFYGLVARETLGMPTRLPAASATDTHAVETLPNVRRAIELANIGERTLAEEALRHQARIGRAADQRALIAVAQKLDLAGAQYWLATNGQPGASVEAAAHYPRPRWTPQNGWRVDPALALGHALQESAFRTTAVSQAGAVGLMQVRPGTAGDTARGRGASFATADLTDPSINLDYGQAFIELLRSNAATRGQLPRVIAAYNAGPVPVERWNAIADKGDPLLWIESIPYWETRYYVPAVMRNMWVYQGLAGGEQPTLRAMAQHKWPAFPAR